MSQDPKIDHKCAYQHGPCAGTRAAVLVPWLLLWAAAEHQHGPCSGTRAAGLVPWFFYGIGSVIEHGPCAEARPAVFAPRLVIFHLFLALPSSLMLGHLRCFVQTCNLYTTKQTA